jgi:hypothetical protein
MGFLFTTEGVYAGQKTGNKKNSSDLWIQYKFRIPEIYKGHTIHPANLSEPNASAFPVDSFELPQGVNPGDAVRVDFEISARIGNNRAFPEFRLVRLQKKA